MNRAFPCATRRFRTTRVRAERPRLTARRPAVLQMSAMARAGAVPLMPAYAWASGLRAPMVKRYRPGSVVILSSH